MSSNLCITVVEDNSLLCDVTVELLRQHGHRAQGVTCAESLTDEALDPMLDVLLVDLNLPGEDGLSLIARYRKTCPGLTVIVVSSRDSLDDRLACYNAGADAFLAKPTHPDELLAVVRSLTRNRSHHRISGQPDATAIDEFTATLDMRRLLLSGPTGTVEIPAAAAAMLSALALAPGRRLASWQIVQAFGQNTDQYTAAALGVRMVRLRALMRAVGFEDNTIRSLRSDGYQLCVPVTIL